MKRRIILSIALTLSAVLVLLTSSDSTAQAQNQIRIVADTGVISLGPNQALRIAVAGPVGVVNPEHHILEFRRISYTDAVCSGNVCKQAVASVTNSGAVTLTPGEAALFDMIDPTGRVVVLSSSRKLRVNAIIIDRATGEIVAFQKHWEVIE